MSPKKILPQFPSQAPTGCAPGYGLKGRRRLSHDEATELRGLFKILANETRLRLLYALAMSDEMCVTDLATAVEMKPQAVSNQLQRLVDSKTLISRRQGNNVFYRINDPCLSNILMQGICILETERMHSSKKTKERQR